MSSPPPLQERRRLRRAAAFSFVAGPLLPVLLGVVRVATGALRHRVPASVDIALVLIIIRVAARVAFAA